MKKVKLGEIADIITGPFGSMLHASDYVDIGIPSIMPQNIKNGTIDRTNIAYITEEDAERLANYRVIKGDIVYSRRGDIEKCAYIDTVDTGALCGTGCLRIRPDSSKVNPLFLSQYLSRGQTRKWIVDHANGSLMPNLNTAILKMVPLELPDIKIQENIAILIKTLDSKISLNNKINAELESMAKTIYDYWFTQFDFPDENGRPYKSSGGKMEWNEELQREIPTGWEVKKLDDCGNFKNGINYEKNCDGDKTVRIINVRNISESTCYILPDNLDLITLPEASLQQYIAEKDDILIARSGIPGATRLLINNQETVIYCGFIIRYKVNVLCEKIYLYQTIKQYEQRNIAQAAGTVLKNVSQDILKNIQIVLPQKDIIENFNEKEMPIYNTIQSKTEENNKLSKIRDCLLPMLMNDQVEI